MTQIPSILSADNALADVTAWRRSGLRTALVTLINIDGATPRPLGAQMAVAEDGRFTGYLSGGCLEQAIALEARAAIARGANKLARYGKGSAYFDIKLPCGSGLDVYFDQGIDTAVLEAADGHQRRREAFYLETHTLTGANRIVTANGLRPSPRSELSGATFRRSIVPCPRVLLVGSGPILVAVAQLLTVSGFELSIFCPDHETQSLIRAAGMAFNPLNDVSTADQFVLDPWSAAVVAFHDHDWEAPVLAQILKSKCFYVGVQGSRTAQANRLAKLAAMGFDQIDLARVRGPIGLIPGARSRTTLAVGILAELTAEAKAQGLLA